MEKVLEQPRTSLELELEQDMNMEREGDMEEPAEGEGVEGSVDAGAPDPTIGTSETSEATEPAEDDNLSERKEDYEEESGAGAEGIDPCEIMDTDVTDMNEEVEGTEDGEVSSKFDPGRTVQESTNQEMV